MEELIEIRPGKRYFHRAYTGIMLWFLGRAVRAAARVDREVAGEFSKMPDKYTFSLGAFPCGPYMVVGKDEKEGRNIWAAILKNIRFIFGYALKALAAFLRC